MQYSSLFFLAVLLNMLYHNIEFAVFFKLLCKTLSHINTAMSASGTAKINTEKSKLPLLVFVYALLYHCLCRKVKFLHFGFFFQVFDDLLVCSAKLFVLFVSSGVGKTSAIKHKAASVSAGVMRIDFVEREALDIDSEFVALF